MSDVIASCLACLDILDIHYQDWYNRLVYHIGWYALGVRKGESDPPPPVPATYRRCRAPTASVPDADRVQAMREAGVPDGEDRGRESSVAQELLPLHRV